MSYKAQITSGVAPSGASHHEGVVLGLLAVIVLIRLVESKRLPAAWAAVFGAAGGSQTPAAPSAPNAANVAPGALRAP